MPAPAKTWLLTSEKLGDTAQARLVANALGWPTAEVPIAVRERFRFSKPAMRPSLDHIEPVSAAQLRPPWPKLAIAAGRRMAMVLLWLKAESGGETRIVYLGRPQRHLERFDLVIAPSQFRVPSAPNVMPLAYPLVRVEEAALARAKQAWQNRLASLPKPLVVLLIGGPQRVLRFDSALALDLLNRTAALARADSGSLYVSTSRRTPPDIAEALAGAMPTEAHFHRWTPAAQENPYLGLLAHGDAFVVTGDSISMLIEVAGLGRPLAIYRQPPPSNPWRRGLQLVGRAVDEETGHPALRHAGRLLYRLGLASYPRNLSALHARLIEEGYAVPFGERLPTGGRCLPSELPAVAERIRALFS